MLIAVLVAAAVAIGQDNPQSSKPKADTPGQVADKVLAALAAKDATALKALAGRDEPDPWFVVDELCFRKKWKGALAFVAHAKDRKGMASYVREHRGKPFDQNARERLGEAQRLLVAKNRDAAIAKLSEADPAARDVSSAWALYMRGFLLRPKWGDSSSSFETAAASAARLGWLALAAKATHERGANAYYAGDWATASKVWRLRLKYENKRGVPAALFETLRNIGLMERRRGSHESALGWMKRLLETTQSMTDANRLGEAFTQLGKCHDALGQYEESATQHGRALTAYRKAGNRLGEAQAMVHTGAAQAMGGSNTQAIETLERALPLARAAGDKGTLAAAVGNLGVAYMNAGLLDRSRTLLEKSLQLDREIGRKDAIAADLVNLGIVSAREYQVDAAIKYLKQGLEQAEAAGHDGWAYSALENLGQLHLERGQLIEAQALFERALRRARRSSNQVAVATTLGNLATTHAHLGSAVRAIELEQDAVRRWEQLGNAEGHARALAGLGGLFLRMGNLAEAAESSERALTIMEKRVSSPRARSSILSLVSAVRRSTGDTAGATRAARRALKAATVVGDRRSMAEALMRLAETTRGRPEAIVYLEQALEHGMEIDVPSVVVNALVQLSGESFSAANYEQALKLALKAHAAAGPTEDPSLLAPALLNAAVAEGKLGRHREARKHRAEVTKLVGNAGLVELEVFNLWGIAWDELGLGRPRESVRAAREAVERLPLLVSNLDDETAAHARSFWAGLIETGVAASAELAEPEAAFYFMESGRAGALLESMGARTALRRMLVPASLRELESTAQQRVAEARSRFKSARRSGRRAAIRESLRGVEESYKELLKVVERIQRASKLRAQLAYPKAARLSAIQARLAIDDALIEYAFTEEHVYGLVVSKKTARLVDLGPSRALSAVLAKARFNDRGHDPTPIAKALRHALLVPLGLPAHIKRVLVCPDGPLAQLPFGLLAGARTVAYAPSASTLDALAASAHARGRRVLAIGDPHYASSPRRPLALVRGGRELAPLPATRKEVEAIGDVQLLGRHATEARLRAAMEKETRWRSVHFACHGLIRADQPQLSSLAITPDDKSDGLLSLYEILQMRIPTDLAVLSACETASGKVYRAEGIFGLTHAFMVAGASRVLVSLWKVDDEATRALMVKFYELWKTQPTATALKKAQEFVRGHEKWKHPYYWAAWQLWGLPD